MKNNLHNTQRSISLHVEGEMIAGQLILPEILKKKNPAVLFIHGWQSDYEGYIPRAQALAKLGYVCFVFDMRGHGKSDGKIEEVTAENSLKDAKAAYDFLAGLPEVDGGQISVVGSSYGGYIASLLVGERHVASLVLRVPALFQNATVTKSMQREIFEEREKRVFEKFPPDNFALLAVGQFSGQILLISSEFDEQIPKNMTEAYRNAAKSLKEVIIKGADHSLTKSIWKERFVEILVEWFGALGS